ncbi:MULTISPECIES: tail fiber protein [unclassified Paenibacillus]|uniref:tail fiber protein n=1 Tax=unclassified Paenibacillus TaxID=185978 RepID=UPI0009A62237|nr:MULTISPECIES: tail fiber protein [unclassified Paenibacillus]SLJ92661.1 Phage tail fibre repeat-containing protein [Paenibacillus sp. RU5A]SOC58541.1 Phage tail fibre repeat-containing protein [Paenibacillus sp. RU26A]SOC67593.1 Phage tail fibre repeat-containing protein [Paenibacillus sp. RU5M]
MANRFANLEGSKKINEDFQNINIGFDRVQAEIDTKGTPADAQAKADAAKAAAIATAAEALAAHKARGADEHPAAKGNAAGFMSAADKLLVDARTSAATPDTLMQRDAEGRAKVAAPAAANDIARKAETDAIQANLDNHAGNANVHVTAADHTKLNGIAAGAEVNQNAFAKVNDVEASSKSDTVVFVGGTGITVTTDPEGKRIVLTATGEATPGAHASSHITGGTDVIPDAVVGGSSGLMSGADAKFVRQDGESKTGAQAKADAAKQAANEYTDQKVGEIVIDDASLTQKGITQLSSATESDEEGEAATPKAVNTVRKQADTKIGNLSELQTTDKDNLVDALNEVFQSGSEFKGDIADAITAKGVPTSASDSKDTFVQHIESIETSTVINGQQKITRTFAETIVANDPVYVSTTFEPDVTISERPVNAVYKLSWSHDGQYLACPFQTAPYLYIYKRVGKSLIKLSDPDVMPNGSANSASFSPDGNYLVVAHTASPFITIYKRSGDVFTKLANPAILPTGQSQAADFSLDGIYMAVAHNESPYVTVYKRSGDLFTKLANPTSLATSSGRSVDFSPDGTYLAVTHFSSPYLSIYKRTGDTLTKLANPTTLPNSIGNSAKFTKDGNTLALGSSSTAPNNLILYSRNGDVFTKADLTYTLPSTTVYCVEFIYIDDTVYLAAGIAIAPYVMLYRLVNKELVKQSDIIGLPGSGNGLSATRNGELLAVGHPGVPYLTVYSGNYDYVRKSTNSVAGLANYMTGIGYALESGNRGESKEIMTIWR